MASIRAFFSRSEEVKHVRQTLDPQEVMGRRRVMSICGLGGVRKTQPALHYPNTSMSLHEVMAQIPSEYQIKTTQAMTVFDKTLAY
jgi:hypothetical protein